LNSEKNLPIYELADIIMGQSPKGDTYNDMQKGSPLLNGPTEFGRFHPSAKTWTTKPTKVSKKDDLIFCVRGSTTGRMNWSNIEYCIGRGVCVIRGKKSKIDTKFVYYSLLHKLKELLAIATGSVFPNLSKDNIGNFLIFCPDPITRKNIVNKLNSLDHKIEILELQKEILEKMIFATFKSWFIDYEGQTKFFESELDTIPSGWQVKELGNLVSIKGRIGWRGYTSDDLTLKGPLVIGGKHIGRNNQLNLNNPTHISWKKYNESTEIQIVKGNIIVTKNGNSIGRIALVDRDIGPATINPNVVLLKNFEFPFYLFYYLLSPYAQHFLLAGASGGSAIPTINNKTLKKMKILIPFKQKLNRFETFTKSINRQIIKNEELIMNHKKIRNYILPKLMSGEIRV